MTYDSNALQWTSAQVLSDIRRKASLPITSTDFPDSVLLREATDMLWSFAGWAMAQAGEGRLTASLDRALASGLFTSSYRSATETDIPPLAIADSIDSISFIDATGLNQQRLTRMELSNESDMESVDSTGSPAAYALMSGRIRLYPQPSTGGTLRIYYQRRHPELVLDNTTNVGTTSAIAANGLTQSTLTMAPAFALPVAGNEVDLIAATSPYRAILSNVTVVSNVGASLVLAVPFTQLANLPTVGLRVVLSGQSPYVHFPLEFRAAVTEKVAANVQRILGDNAGAQASEQAAMMELSRVMQMLSPRSKRDKPRAINPYSHLRMAMRRWGRW